VKGERERRKSIGDGCSGVGGSRWLFIDGMGWMGHA